MSKRSHRKGSLSALSMANVLLASLVLLAGFLPTVALGAAVTDVQLRPPSSLQPVGPTALVTFEHKSRRTKGCGERGACSEKSALDRQVASLHVQLVPIPEPRLGRKDERQPIEFTIPAGTVPNRLAARVPPGQWEVQVSRGRARRVHMREGDATTIEIWTFVGACIRGEDRCLFQADAVRRYIRPR